MSGSAFPRGVRARVPTQAQMQGEIWLSVPQAPTAGRPRLCGPSPQLSRGAAGLRPGAAQALVAGWNRKRTAPQSSPFVRGRDWPLPTLIGRGASSRSCNPQPPPSPGQAVTWAWPRPPRGACGLACPCVRARTSPHSRVASLTAGARGELQRKRK